MLEPVLKNPWVRAVGLLAVLVLAVALAYSLSFVLVPLFMAFLVAYILDPVVDWFERRGVSRGFTIAGLAIVAIVVVVSLPLLVVPSIIGQADSLIRASASTDEAVTSSDKEPASSEGVAASSDEDPASSGGAKTSSDAEEPPAGIAYIDGLIERLPLEDFCVLMGWYDPNQGSESPEAFNPRAEIARRVGEYVKANASRLFQTHLSSFASFGHGAGATLAQVASSVGRGAVGLLLFLANFALFAFVSGYLLKDFDSLITSIRELLPVRYRGKAVELVSEIDLQLRSFLRGQLTVCLCLGTMYSLGLLIAGTPFAVLIGVFGMVASFVPYLGVVITVVPALVLTLLKWGLTWHLLVALLTFVIAQALEGNLLTPKIVGKQVGLNPVWVILAVLVFGNTLGFMGLLLAVPIAATLKVLVVEAVERYRRSRMFEGEAGSSEPPSAVLEES